MAENEIAATELQDVLSLMATYASSIDAKDTDRWTGLFADGAVLTLGPQPLTTTDERAALVAALPAGVHVAGIPAVTKTADGFDAVSSVAFITADSVTTGRYVDSIGRGADGQLRFVSRRMEGALRAKFGAA